MQIIKDKHGIELICDSKQPLEDDDTIKSSQERQSLREKIQIGIFGRGKNLDLPCNAGNIEGVTNYLCRVFDEELKTTLSSIAKEIEQEKNTALPSPQRYYSNTPIEVVHALGKNDGRHELIDKVLTIINKHIQKGQHEPTN